MRMTGRTLYGPRKDPSMADLIKIADAWERERRGNNPGTYIVAVAGGMKFLLLRKSREDPNGSTWTLFVTERSQKPERPSRDAERGNATQTSVRAAADTWTREQRDAPVKELAARVQPDPEIPF